MTAAGQGLIELADRETRAELSAYEGRPVRWAARLSAHGHDVLTYLQACPATAPHSVAPAADEQVVELRPSQMDALRVYATLAPTLASRRPTPWSNEYATPTSTGRPTAGGWQ